MQFSVIVGSYVMNFYMRLPRIINNDGFCHSDHSRQYKIEMSRTFHITATLETRYTQRLFAFFGRQSNSLATTHQVNRFGTQRGESRPT